jgi:hypothetical protein
MWKKPWLNVFARMDRGNYSKPRSRRDSICLGPPEYEELLSLDRDVSSLMFRMREAARPQKAAAGSLVTRG